MNTRLLNFYLNVAKEASKLSRAVRLQVGAVIVKNGNIIAYSWNGTPLGWDNTCEYTVLEGGLSGKEPMLKTKPEVLHAEANAILKVAKSHESTFGSELITTHSPCIECAKMILTCGITKVYYSVDYRSNEGIKMLQKGGVEVTQFSTTN